MKTFKYNDYDHYVNEQIAGNHKKLSWRFKKEHHVKWIKSLQLEANNIICHGTRNGGEQKIFKKYYEDAYIIGTEISDTADQFEMTIQHDFAEPKKEWIGKFDIIYSNSFDHSFNPEKTILTWKSQLSKKGMMFLDWSDRHNSNSTPMDPVSGTTDEFKKFIKNYNINVINEKKFPEGNILLVCIV